jgi:hypothetical protein
MAMKSGNAGGGIRSNKVVRPATRPGMAAKGVNPGHAAQLGRALGNKGTDSAKRLNPVEPKFTQSPVSNAVRLGNEVAASTVCGPGGSRTVMRSGAQGQHGAPAQGNPRSVPGEIFPGFPGNPGKR